MTSISVSELTRIMREQKLVAVNIQFHADGLFRAHVRRGQQFAFTCAMKGHEDVGSALAEHFAATDLSDLLD